MRRSKPILNRFQRSRSGAGAGFIRNAPTQSPIGAGFLYVSPYFGYIVDRVNLKIAAGGGGRRARATRRAGVPRRSCRVELICARPGGRARDNRQHMTRYPPCTSPTPGLPGNFYLRRYDTPRHRGATVAPRPDTRISDVRAYTGGKQTRNNGAASERPHGVCDPRGRRATARALAAGPSRSAVRGRSEASFTVR